MLTEQGPLQFETPSHLSRLALPLGRDENPSATRCASGRVAHEAKRAGADRAAKHARDSGLQLPGDGKAKATFTERLRRNKGL